MTNRRQFLSGCSTLALAATLAPGALFSREAGSEQLSYAAFSKRVGSTFVVKRESGSDLALELTRACLQPASPLAKPNSPDARHEKFSLMFRGPQGAALTQNTYTFEHSQIGRCEIFIVPVGPKDETHAYYQAVFNRPSAAA